MDSLKHLKHLNLAAILLLSIPAFSQTAKVVQLSNLDAETAKSLAQQKVDLDKKISSFNDHIRVTYLKAAQDESFSIRGLTGNGLSIRIKSGWGTGEFEFSEDYKFIVPAKTLTSYPCSAGQFTYATSFYLYPCGSSIIPVGGAFTYFGDESDEGPHTPVTGCSDVADECQHKLDPNKWCAGFGDCLY